jgi:putative hydrolase, CocE/NonD family
LTEEEFELERIKREFSRCPVLPFCNIKEPEEIMLPMADGVSLRTVVYRPETEGSIPAIMVRTCYPKNDYIYRATAREYVKRGFAYIYQYCRGTGGSEGEWEPNVNERADGKQTIDWICAQSWVKNAGYCGCSYLAMTGWSISDILPEKVKTLYLTHYGTHRYVSAYKDGMFRHDILTGWTMENAGYPIEADYLESCRYRPHLTVDEDLWGKKIDWYREYITSTDADDPYWHKGVWQMLKEVPEKVTVPVCFGESWYDHHLGSAIETWLSMPEETRKHSTFLIGAWDHGYNMRLEGKTYENAGNDDILRSFEWFYRILVEEKLPEGEVKMYLTGADKWVSRKEFRDAKAPVKQIYLGSKGADGFNTLKDTKEEYEDGFHYIYNPENPVMSHGAESLLYTKEGIGSLLQEPPGNRDDVISCISEPLQEDMDIAGQIKLHLSVSTDADDTAFAFKIMEMTPDGKSYNIRTGITTLGYRNGSRKRISYTPGDIAEIVIDSWDVAYRVRKGSRVRVDITSSDFPQYSVHSNYAGCWSEQREARTANQTVYFGGKYASRVEIPLLSK